MSPAQKRAAARALTERGRAPAAACRRVELPRSTYYYQARERPGEARLRRKIEALAERFPRFGSRRITAMLQREGLPVNAKRVQRLWQAAGLQVRRKKCRRRWQRQEPWPDRARCRNHVWTVDFLFDRTLDGRQMKILSVVDEYTREVVALHPARSITSTDVGRVLEDAAAKRGKPAYVRSDNGPEFVSLAEARVVIEGWRRQYNDQRPHSSLGYLTPSEYAARPCGHDSAPLRQPRRGADSLSSVT